MGPSHGKPDLISRARVFATAAHGDQKRKYTFDPYIVHPEAVAALVATRPHTPEMIAAALLHDVVEDTPVTIEEVRAAFGDTVAVLVAHLTDVSRLEDGNRVARKALDRAHTAKASPQAKTIKLADLIDNARSIIPNAPGFAKVYLREKAALLEVLGEGDAELLRMAEAIVAGAKHNLRFVKRNTGK